MFIIGRVLVAFGLGVLAEFYMPQAFTLAALPAVVIGLALLVIAARGLRSG